MAIYFLFGIKPRLASVSTGQLKQHSSVTQPCRCRNTPPAPFSSNSNSQLRNSVPLAHPIPHACACAARRRTTSSQGFGMPSAESSARTNYDEEQRFKREAQGKVTAGLFTFGPWCRVEPVVNLCCSTGCVASPTPPEGGGPDEFILLSCSWLLGPMLETEQGVACTLLHAPKIRFRPFH
jgi:hypothetical protein